MNTQSASTSGRQILSAGGLGVMASAISPAAASAMAPGQTETTKGRGQTGSVASLKFILDKNLELPTDKAPWVDMVSKANIEADATFDLVHINTLLRNGGPDIAYIPGADFCKLVLAGGNQYRGLVIATSKFTCEPWQKTLLVVRKDDPAKSIADLAGSEYAYMNKSCSSSYFPPAIILRDQGRVLSQFLKLVEVAGWQPRVDAVVAGRVRSTMILEDVWKMTPDNERTCKIIGSMDKCPPAILAVHNRVDAGIVNDLRRVALSYMPSWEIVYGAFRPYFYADVQPFVHSLSQLPASV